MINDTLQNATRAVHDVGLAAWLGGSMFGKFALNPAVAGISDKSERGKVANLAWNGYNVVNAVGLGSAAAGYFAARQTELGNKKRYTSIERNLYRVQDGLMISAVVTGIANGVQGARLAKQGENGAVPIETGTKPAPETPPAAAKIQRSLEVLGNVNILTGIGLVALNGMLSRAAMARPPLRRALFRRSTP
jgi:hypothetical protein